MQCLATYIALQQRPPGCIRDNLEMEYPMTHTATQLPTASERMNNLVAEIFQGATIALVGILGILTVAATI